MSIFISIASYQDPLLSSTIKSACNNAANEADGAIAIVYNGTISDKTLDIASEAAIETVVGTKAGKGYGDRDDVKSWLAEVHR